MSKNKGRGPCPSGKAKFTQAGAEWALLEAKIQRGLRGNTRRREQRAYDCPFCAWWHLTSRPQAERRAS